MIYYVPPPDDPVSQGDILDECPIVRHAAGGGVEQATGRIVVLTQACDLAQHKAKYVVVALVFDASAYVEAGEVKPGAVRDQVRFGKVFGQYYLPAAAVPPLPESIIDLRRLHTIPRPLLDTLVASGRRVCRLAVPYREHLAQHFAVTYMRIALPEPYPTAP